MSYVHLGGTDADAFTTRLRQNKAAVDAAALVLQVAGATLSASVLFAPVGVPMVALGGGLVAIANGGLTPAALRTQAKLLSQYATICEIALGVLTPLLLLGVVSAPGAAATGPLAILCGSLRRVFGALEQGRSPTTQEIGGVITQVAALGKVDLKPLTDAMSGIDKFLGLGRQVPGFAEAEASIRRGAPAPSAELRAKMLRASVEASMKRAGVSTAQIKTTLDRVYGSAAPKAPPKTVPPTERKPVDAQTSNTGSGKKSSASSYLIPAAGIGILVLALAKK